MVEIWDRTTLQCNNKYCGHASVMLMRAQGCSERVASDTSHCSSHKQSYDLACFVVCDGSGMLFDLFCGTAPDALCSLLAGCFEGALFVSATCTCFSPVSAGCSCEGWDLLAPFEEAGCGDEVELPLG